MWSTCWLWSNIPYVVVLTTVLYRPYKHLYHLIVVGFRANAHADICIHNPTWNEKEIAWLLAHDFMIKLERTYKGFEYNNRMRAFGNITILVISLFGFIHCIITCYLKYIIIKWQTILQSSHIHLLLYKLFYEFLALTSLILFYIFIIIKL